MQEINRLIDFNIEKISYLNAYLDSNKTIEDLIALEQFSNLEALVSKKRAIAQSIDVIDDKIIRALSLLKQAVGITDLAQLDIKAHPDAEQLKIEAGKVLQLMVKIKQSDEKLLKKIDASFKKYGNSTRAVDKNKLYYYTKNLLK